MRSPDSARKRSTIALGNSTCLARTTHRAWATVQNFVRGKTSFHHDCHRTIVRRSAPKRFWRRADPFGVGPWRMAVMRTTMTPR